MFWCKAAWGAVVSVWFNDLLTTLFYKAFTLNYEFLGDIRDGSYDSLIYLGDSLNMSSTDSGWSNDSLDE